jgi:iron(III) transport system substrate-binding protein
MKMRWLAPLAFLLAGCPGSGHDAGVAPAGSATPTASEEARVVVYCAHDREYAEPILDGFTKETGIQVDAKWDSEAAKTTGLTQALLAERARPRCDLFWSNEAAQASLLAKEGVLAPSDLRPDATVRDPEGRWVGFAARARVLLVHNKVPEADRPRSIEDLAQPRWKGKCGIANPLFGSTSTHVAALVAKRGEEWTRKWLRSLRENQVVVCAGNGDVKNRVADGELAFGLTDSDDANVARLDGKPVVVVFPDQDGPGTLVIPNAIGVVAGAPRPANARKLAAFLLTARVEESLARSSAVQLPILPGSKARPEGIPEGLVTTPVDWAAAASSFATARELVRAELLGEGK